MNQPKDTTVAHTGGLSRSQSAQVPKKTQAWRPATKNECQDGRHCPHCGNACHSGWAVCPQCGHSLCPDKCSFCGATLKPGKKFCTHCGASREGISCPQCGTLNARNFCRSCNMPLTEMGQAALADALADPQFTIVRHKAEEMASLLSQINRLEQGGGTGSNEKEPERVYLTEADRAMLDEYRDLLASVRTISPSSTEAEQPSEETRRTYSAPTPSISELLEAYRAKANEMNAALAAMTPPAGFTPEQQRDYYAARKVASIETEYDLSDYTPTMWQCNYCGALHNTPSACVQPELGGTWIAVTPEQYIKAHGEHIVTRRSFIIE